MNLKQAHYVKTIAECGSITAAARKLFVSQPSLSQMLHQLEQEIGLPLFDRSASPLQLTYAGEKFLHAAERMLAANAELENQLREIRHEHAGRLRLGISVTRAMQVLPKVLPLFAQQYPHVVLEMTEGGSATLEERLLAGQVDLALAALESTRTGITYELLEKEFIGILAGKNTIISQRLPSGTPVSLEEAQHDPFIYLLSTHSVRIIQDKLFRQQRFTPRILLETDTLEVGRRIAVEGGACMLLPNIYIDDYVYRFNGSFFPIANYENNRHFYACCRKNEFIPRYTRDFIQITARVLAQENENQHRRHNLP